MNSLVKIHVHLSPEPVCWGWCCSCRLLSSFDAARSWQTGSTQRRSCSPAQTAGALRSSSSTRGSATCSWSGVQVSRLPLASSQNVITYMALTRP